MRHSEYHHITLVLYNQRRNMREICVKRVQRRNCARQEGHIIYKMLLQCHFDIDI